MAEPTTLPTTTTPAATSRPRRRLPDGVRIAVLAALALAAAAGILLHDIPVPFGEPGFTTILQMRLVSVATILVVAFCHGVGTVIFHTATSNRILTPSILGFDALYRLIQTALVFVLGNGAFAATDGLGKVALQSLLMIAFATALYGWLFSGRRTNLHVLLLVGVVLGMGFSSLATFMQRMLTPSEFDVLTARLFGNISASNAAYLPWAALVCVVVGWWVWRRRHVLDVLALGRETATSLGLRYQREVVGVLVVVAVLVSVATSLVGPMTFFGFVVALLTYQLVLDTSHSRTLPMVVVVATAALLGAYFVLRHVFYAQGMISIIIELVGGAVFLVYLLRKGLR